MTKVAEALQQSRGAHKQARQLRGEKKLEAARALFRIALDGRLKARELDPGRTDPAWDDDLRNLHAGVRWAREDRGLPARFDLEIETYLRQQLGAEVNTDVSAGPDGAVLPPMRWEASAEGATACLACTHPKHGHPCGGHLVEAGIVVPCPCAGYVPMVCRHTWRVTPADATVARSRTCVGCGEVQQLHPAVALEATLAFQQRAKESKR